jgi:hypothetical protein
MRKLIKYFTENQKALLLTDSIGALMTAFFLFVIMRQFDEFFGTPKEVVTWLSAIAILYSIYSAACFLFLKRDMAPFIRIIGIANLLYCVLTIGLLIKNNATLTVIGTIYFLIEITIICGLSYLEIKVAGRMGAEHRMR